ncbi:MAG TPA: hypothetical protein VGZ00_03575 [Candidatus Baltobacteraceae bacterium]|jgi:hypothetical protein|nr:hypothetical protein [Candidatus Baltobacteraceae bacterium]
MSVSPIRIFEGTVINVHLKGATVRLSTGTIAAVTEDEVEVNRPIYEEGLKSKQLLRFYVSGNPRRPVVVLEQSTDPGFTKAEPLSQVRTEVVPRSTAPPIRLINPEFEKKMDSYLRSVEGDASEGTIPLADIRQRYKRRRARRFEAQKEEP